MLSDVLLSVSAQRDAITHRGGPLLVLGGPGTGKTAIIEQRFCWMVDQGARPERLAIVVPSQARADMLRARLERMLAHGYEELFVLTPVRLAMRILHRVWGEDAVGSLLSAGDRLAMLLERLDALSLQRHDFAGSVNVLVSGFIRRIDRLKAELIGPEEYSRWARSLPAGGEFDAEREREFAEVYWLHERLLAEEGASDAGNLLQEALRAARDKRGWRFEELLLDDAQELDLAAARLVRAAGGRRLVVAGDPVQAVRRFRGAGAAGLGQFEGDGVRVIRLKQSFRCGPRLLRAASAVAGRIALDAVGAAEESVVAFWRCASERAQAQAVAADVERLTAREGVAPGETAILVPSVAREGHAVSIALEERAVAHRLVGEGAFFQRAEIRDLLAWLRLLADPSDAGAVVRALARPPIDLRSVDIARCTQIARRRKLDMVGALAAATESPQVPPEARERIRVFFKLYRSSMAAIDTTRPDLYVHRLIDRLGLRRAQLFAAQADVVQRLRALARFEELASDHVQRAPQATPREFARSIAAVADAGMREQEEPELEEPSVVQVLALDAAGGLQARHVYLVGLHAALPPPAFEAIPDPLLAEPLPPDSEESRRQLLRQELYVGMCRASERVVLCYPAADDRGAAVTPAASIEAAREALGAAWEEKEEELFGPAETVHATYRLLRDELLEATMRTGGRIGELRFDTDLDISHAVVRYLELLKLAALIARPEGQSVADALRDVNARIGQAVTAEQREIFNSSALDEYLLDAERDMRRRTRVMAARDEPSLEAFLPTRGDGVVLSASDIDTYRTCPLKYKFARVFRIPQEPSIHQRFGILLHQVLERFHGREEAGGTLPELLGLLEAGWRRGGFGDSEEERQLRGKAVAALERYHARFQSEESQPLWFERAFTFKLGPHLLRGRVDRVDRLPGGEYELIDYKTGRPKSAAQLEDDVQLSLYAVGAREAWSLDASRQAYYYVLDDQKVAVASEGHDREEWIREVAMQVADGIRSQGFEPTPSVAACSVCDYRLVCPAAEM